MNERHLLASIIVKTEQPIKSNNKFKIKSSDFVSISLILIGLAMIFRPDNFDTKIISLVVGVLFVFIGIKNN